VNIAEIFTSIQGESTFCGFPCTFIRVAGCNLRCSYCDTPYAFEGGEELKVGEILGKVRNAGIPLVEITGGEPLLQEECYMLITHLLGEGYTVLLETNGSLSLKKVDRRVVKITDIKCPGSGMSAHMDFSNIEWLNKKDEVKFVVSNRGDFDWAGDIIDRYGLLEKCTVLMSPELSKLEPREIAGWIMEGKRQLRLQLQLHKIIWPELNRGV